MKKPTYIHSLHKNAYSYTIYIAIQIERKNEIKYFT